MSGASGAGSGARTALSARGVSKQFGARLVLDRFSIEVPRGEVHALLGANGSGKSTFVKIVSGNQPATAVEHMAIGGVEVPAASSVTDMQTRGLRVVHQDLGLIEELTIAENIALGRHFVRSAGGRIDWRATREAAQEAVDTVGLHRSVRTPVADLAAWERVGVVFARVLFQGVEKIQLLILDEITAALPSEEVERVMEIVGKLKQAGAGVLYVTHRFEEVFRIADTLSVLRDGRLIHRSPTADTTPPQLVNLVAGQSMRRVGERRDVSDAPVRVELDHVSNAQLRGVSLSVRAGEIVGVVGRAGCGRSALGRTVFGLQSVRDGQIRVNGRPIVTGKPWQALKAGIAYVGQDRNRAGSIHGATVEENFTIGSLAQLTGAGWIGRRKERALARQLIEQCKVMPPDPNIMIEKLSGGNQQKIVVGRWIPREPAVMVLDEPTEGVDVGARHGIYELVRAQVARGCAVLVLSSSIEELVSLCDRVVFMVDGAVANELSGDDLTTDAIEKLLLYREADAAGELADQPELNAEAM